MECLRCGECCKAIGNADVVGPIDVKRWMDEKRHDILKWLDLIPSANPNAGQFGYLQDWIHPTTGAVYESCPFLHKKKDMIYCRIYETRPIICREYEPGSGRPCPLYDEVT